VRPELLFPDADALRPSEDPTFCSGAGFRGGVGFIG